MSDTRSMLLQLLPLPPPPLLMLLLLPLRMLPLLQRHVRFGRSVFVR